MSGSSGRRLAKFSLPSEFVLPGWRIFRGRTGWLSRAMGQEKTERGRFELPLPLRADRFSKPAHSAALPPLQGRVMVSPPCVRVKGRRRRYRTRWSGDSRRGGDLKMPLQSPSRRTDVVREVSWPMPNVTPSKNAAAAKPAGAPAAPTNAPATPTTTPARGPDRRQSVVDRRCGLDRRQKTREEAGYTGPERRSGIDRRAATGLERRRGPGRRRSDDRKAAEEGEMTAEQFEFCMAIQTYKKVNKKMYPTWTEVLELIRQLGYRKVMPREIRLENVPEPTIFPASEEEAA
jgi:hypothetical protein